LNSIEKRGRIYLAGFIAVLVLGDLLLKGFLLAAGTLRWSQVVGTGVTLLVSWFLWRGSGFAYWLMVICTAAAVVFALLAASTIPAGLAVGLGVFMCSLLVVLLVPATRKFVVYQRAARA
jgi:hypothetical protein